LKLFGVKRDSDWAVDRERVKPAVLLGVNASAEHWFW